MSATPETDKAIIEADGAWTFALKDKMQSLERERDEALEMALELLDALENCREDSVELLGEWDWKRGTIPRNDAAIEQLEGRISVADSVIDKVKEVLP